MNAGSDFLDPNSDSTTRQLSDHRQVTQPVWVSSFQT